MKQILASAARGSTARTTGSYTYPFNTDTHYSTTFVSYSKVCILTAGTDVAAGVHGMPLLTTNGRGGGVREGGDDSSEPG